MFEGSLSCFHAFFPLHPILLAASRCPCRSGTLVTTAARLFNRTWAPKWTLGSPNIYEDWCWKIPSWFEPWFVSFSISRCHVVLFPPQIPSPSISSHPTFLETLPIHVKFASFLVRFSRANPWKISKISTWKSSKSPSSRWTCQE